MLWPLPPRPEVTDTVTYVRQFFPRILQSVSAQGNQLTDIKPGWALLLCAGFGLAGAVWARTVAATFFALAAFALAALVVFAGPLTTVFWSALPPTMIAATSGAVVLRLSLVWIALLALAGFWALAWAATAQPRVHRVALVLLALATIATVIEVRRIAAFSRSLTLSAAQSELQLRPENVSLFVFSGAFIGNASYFSHGVRDPRLESRWLDPQTGAVRNPLTQAPVEQTLTLMASPEPTLPGWWTLTPSTRILPDRPGVWSFRFADPAPRGVLVASATDIYREYLLPESGNASAFGAGPTHSRAVPLWTTTRSPQDVFWRFRHDGSSEGLAFPRPFADLEWRSTADRFLPIKTLTWTPQYRALTRVEEPFILETPRTWIPGYRARRNGVDIEPVRTREGLVGVPLLVGENEVEVRFEGSPRYWRGIAISAVAWTLLLAWGTHSLWRDWRRNRTQ
jgi:hypothetical protein